MPRTMRLVASLLIASLPATATAAGHCWNAAPSGIAFGSYDPTSGAPSRGAGTIRFSCVGNNAPVVGLTAGSAGTYFHRAMSSGGNRLVYNIYRDAGLTEVWGNGSGGTYTAPAPKGLNVSLPMYSQIFARQDVPAGTYADTITVVINY